MTNDQKLIIGTAIGEAIRVLPHGTDCELEQWVMEHWYPAFNDDLQKALRGAGLPSLIHEAREGFVPWEWQWERGNATTTSEQRRAIEAAIDEAIMAAPGDTDREVADWVMTHRYPSFPQQVKDALIDAGLVDVIQDVAGRGCGLTQ